MQKTAQKRQYFAKLYNAYKGGFHKLTFKMHDDISQTCLNFSRLP